jgi:MmyB-like transcription regulator ligand binding domain
MEIEILKRASAYFARYNFLDPGAADFYDDWDGAADTTVALLRAEAGRHPHDKALRELVGELSTLSPASPPCSAGSTGRRVHRFGPHLSLASRRHSSCTWSASASTSTARPPATTPSSINRMGFPS